ncbi:MAG: hypothetical protein ACD_20C00421G0006 [uncultured bacterium]|nr:MAG: hypothetical protein ACD_20C00421G0006 [uncultured bacterium]
MSALIGIGRIFTPKNATLGVITANMVCRPIITMSNKQIPEETRKYTATREFFTELFGLGTTYTFASAMENVIPKVIAKKLFNTDLTKNLANQIKSSGWDQLSPINQKIKGSMALSSFAGTAIAVAILTPLLNNIVLNKIMDRINGKNKKDATPTPVNQLTTNAFQKLNQLKLNA